MRVVRALLQSCAVAAILVGPVSVGNSEPAKETIYVVINAEVGRAEIGTEEYAMKQCRFWSSGKGTCRVAKTCSEKGTAGVVRAPSAGGYWMQAGCASSYSAVKEALMDSCRDSGFTGCEMMKTHTVR